MHEAINIVAATDEAYAMPTAACLRSVLDNTPAPISFMLLVDEVSTATIDRMRKSVHSPQTTIEFRDIADMLADRHFPMQTILSKEYPRTVWATVLLEDLLPAAWDRAIYLDGDTVTLTSLLPLWNTEMRDFALAAVQDDPVWTISSEYGVSMWKELHLDPDLLYFNSGVMLIDLDSWRADKVSQRCMKVVRDYRNRIKQLDQEVLNAVLAGRWCPLDKTWNVTSWWKYAENRVGKFENIVSNAKIYHFTGRSKPWTKRGENVPHREAFFKYLDRTEWRHWRPV